MTVTKYNTKAVSPKYQNLEPQLLSKRFKWVKGFFYSTLVADLLLIIGAALIFTTDFSTYDPLVDYNYIDYFTIAGGLIYLVAFIGSIISFSMFSHRAMKNLHIMGARSPEMSPGWTVGWYFIPFANWWKPFQAMQQIWDGSEDVVSEAYKPAKLIGVWWGCWVLTNILSNISFRMSLRDFQTEASYETMASIDIVASALSIIAVLCILPLLKIIKGRQDGKILSMSFD